MDLKDEFSTNWGFFCIISFPAGKVDERKASGAATEPLGTAVCAETEACRGDRAQGEVTGVSCRLGNREEKALMDSAATVQRGFYYSVTSSRPSSPRSQHCGGLLSTKGAG